MTEDLKTKKALILETAREIKVQQWTPAEIDQLRRRLLAEHGEAGKTGMEYIADVLKDAGQKVTINQQEEAEEQYEEEFEDLLHFKTLEDAEVSIMRLDELMRKFRLHGEHTAVERVLNVARLGKRRAEMISRNRKVEAQKRAEKVEIAGWFRIWLETPDAFFDWLDVRKQSPDFRAKFAVGLELVETENREPVRGKDAAEIWSAVFPALVGNESYVVDFFSHIERVREFCKIREIALRDAAERCVVLPQPNQEQLRQIFERFEGETFGIRAGRAARSADAALEGDLSKRGLDAYQLAYGQYNFCAICEPEDGWVTLLSASLWPSEIIRRVRPAVQPFDIHIARPN